ncbi:superfamily II DNA and RNA helicases [Geminocystis sp. NIES-3709]|nr:superfamily II DNA and RNA helicases [Geminocystis sp. NIES-3709]
MLSFGTVACGSSNSVNTNNPTTFNNNTSTIKNNIASGQYPVQQATFNDVDGEYTLMLLNTPAGSSPLFRTTNLQMARLTDEEIKNGQQTFVEINGNEAIMHLTEDFRIEYVHNETETVTNPNTGQQETVIVRQQSSFWSPFAGALAGQALGSMLFRPQYYVPPVYQSGGNLTGFGGYGSSYDQAVQSYRTNNNAIPPVEKNRQSVRTTGTIKNSSGTSINKVNTNSTKGTGSGVGSSNLKTSGTSSKAKQPSNNSFGSNKSSGVRRTTPSRRSGSFGSRRRR